MDNVPPIDQRNKRLQQAISLQEPDVVPFAPTMNNYYALNYGVTIQEAMTNPLCLKEPLNQFLDRYDPDLLNSPTFFPIPPMQLSGYTAARWAGVREGLGPNTPYQYIDQQYLADEDYDDFIADPSRFILKKLLPRKHAAFAGLELMDLQMYAGQSIYNLASLGLPPVRHALEMMIKTGELIMENLGQMMQLDMMCIGRGYPVFGGAVALCPFDEFADYVRGLLTACVDCMTEPDRLQLAVERWGNVTIPAAIASAKMQHAQYLFIPLHCGTDEFMSTANYQKFYWPPLKRLISAAIEADLTPFILCEGKYYSRLEVISDVPKGKVIYCFENTDFAQAKKILGNVACIAGGMPTSHLMNGNRQSVIDATKRIIDICAPGGGFIMSNSLALDAVKDENMDAWRQTILDYGKY